MKIGWGQRLARARELHGKKNKTTFPPLVGSNRTSWAGFEEEAGVPTLDILIRVQKETGVSLDWLATGQGPMLVKDRSYEDVVRECLGLAIDGTVELMKEHRDKLPEELSKGQMETLMALYRRKILSLQSGIEAATDAELVKPQRRLK